MEQVQVVRHQINVQPEATVQHEYVIQFHVDVENGVQHEVQVVVQ